MPVRIVDQDPSRLDIEPDEADRFADDVEEHDDRSRVVAFLLGGVIIASGLLGILYYDSAYDRDVMTTGSVGRIEAQAGPVPAKNPAR